MKINLNILVVNNLEQLTTTIHQTNQYFLNKAQKQVNTAMTLRNRLIGCHIIEYEPLGEDRAEYGQKVLETLAARLKAKGLKGMAEINLKLYRQFYNLYPQIRQTVSDEFKAAYFMPHHTPSSHQNQIYLRYLSILWQLVWGNLF
jgi:DUF1016 N-terminal domain